MRFHPHSVLLSLPLLLASLMPTAAHAILPGDLYFGYSHLPANSFYPNSPGLNGWEAVGQLKFMPFLGVEAEVGRYGYGTTASVPRITMVLAGPRVTVGTKRLHLFVRGLVGGEHAANSGAATPISGGALAVDFGGGADIRFATFLSWRASIDYLVAPTQTGSGTHDRIGTGLVFHF